MIGAEGDLSGNAQDLPAGVAQTCIPQRVVNLDGFEIVYAAIDLNDQPFRPNGKIDRQSSDGHLSPYRNALLAQASKRLPSFAFREVGAFAKGASTGD
ncbi:MAG: hypothetical protein AAF642_06495 [Pseudomonadota bacterium]